MMARTKRAAAQEELLTDAPSEPNATVEAPSPQSIADEIKAAVQTEELGGVVSTAGPARTRASVAAQPVLPPAPQWTAKGIGQVIVRLNNGAAAAYDMPEAEPEEAAELAESGAQFLNAIWPSGAPYEPYARFPLALASFWVPRVTAYRLKGAQLDREHDALTQGVKTPPGLASDGGAN